MLHLFLSSRWASTYFWVLKFNFKSTYGHGITVLLSVPYLEVVFKKFCVSLEKWPGIFLVERYWHRYRPLIFTIVTVHRPKSINKNVRKWDGEKLNVNTTFVPLALWIIEIITFIYLLNERPLQLFQDYWDFCHVNSENNDSTHTSLYINVKHETLIMRYFK